VSSAKANSDLPLRLVSALVLGTLVLAVTWAGGTYFRVLMGIAALLIFREWSTITQVNQGSAFKLSSWLFVLLGGSAIMFGRFDEALLICAVGAFALGVLGFVAKGKLWAAGGVVYALLPAIALSQVRDAQHGLMVIFWIFIIVWGSDIGAYFAGRAIGGPKLAPTISPKKTWSGFLGGLITAIVGTVIWLQFFDFDRPEIALLIAGVTSIFSQLGDLFESWVKRHFNVKDSGQLIPGHGGIMDRVDGLIVAAVAFYLLMLVGVI